MLVRLPACAACCVDDAAAAASHRDGRKGNGRQWRRRHQKANEMNARKVEKRGSSSSRRK